VTVAAIAVAPITPIPGMVSSRLLASFPRCCAVSPDAVVAEFAALLKAYGISAVWGDRYGGVWPRERFGVHGINYQIPGKSASDFYVELLPVLNSRRAELLDHARLVTQLCQLERHAGSAKETASSARGIFLAYRSAPSGARSRPRLLRQS
jgi:hypothetical protein